MLGILWKNVFTGMQRISVGLGDGICVETTIAALGTSIVVNHSFGRAAPDALVFIEAE